MVNRHQPSPRDRRDDVLKICILSDNSARARHAEKLIGQVCRAGIPDITVLRLDEQFASSCPEDLARIASGADLLIISVRSDFDLPLHAGTWLARWIDFRGRDRETALVALIANSGVRPDADKDLIAYLGVVAVLGDLAFFYGNTQIVVGHVKSIQPPVLRDLPNFRTHPPNNIQGSKGSACERVAVNSITAIARTNRLQDSNPTVGRCGVHSYPWEWYG